MESKQIHHGPMRTSGFMVFGRDFSGGARCGGVVSVEKDGRHWSPGAGR